MLYKPRALHAFGTPCSLQSLDNELRTLAQIIDITYMPGHITYRRRQHRASLYGTYWSAKTNLIHVYTQIEKKIRQKLCIHERQSKRLYPAIHIYTPVMLTAKAPRPAYAPEPEIRLPRLVCAPSVVRMGAKGTAI
jgi:hypothetical protein